MTPSGDAKTQLDTFIGKFNDSDGKRIKAVRQAMRKRLPAAHELVYDNYNFFVIGYSPTLRPSDAVVSIVAQADSVSICFIHGATLPDPDKILLGGGKQTRFVRLESARDLARPAIETLIAAAMARSKVGFPASGRGTLVIRAVAPKQRPRRRVER
ncbi:MAG TPA: DUF1801 domain-containing protein [Gemmatimonadales bacterium]|jgi:hypothetical protein